MIGQDYNAARIRPGMAGGHYESYFQRANHPQRPLAFWIRYTAFVPAGAPERALGELWAVFLDGENGRRIAAKTEVSLSECSFDPARLAVRIGEATLEDGRLRGAAGKGAGAIAWDLSWSGGTPPLFLLPPNLYATALPRAKSLVGVPMACYSGSVSVGGESHRIDQWVGSQNHNWGSRHTDRYAYGQVCGFDNAPESFLEVATGRIRFGPLWSPWMTPLVLRHEGREYALTSVAQAVLRARAEYGCFDWTFSSRSKEVHIEGHIHAPATAFVGLRYYNPPGGDKHCLNSKIAACRLVVSRPGGEVQVLETRHRAAFEILTDSSDHGVEISA